MKKVIFLLGLAFLSLSASAQIQQMQICTPTSQGCVPVNNNNPLPIAQNSAPAITTTNASQTIASGGIFQTALNSNTSRHALTVINNNSNGHTCYLYIGSGVASTANSIILVPYAQYFRNAGYVPSDQIQVTCSNTGDTVYVDYE